MLAIPLFLSPSPSAAGSFGLNLTVRSYGYTVTTLSPTVCTLKLLSQPTVV